MGLVDIPSQGLCVRVDADGHVGMGHFIRCLALSQHWRARRGAVDFVSRPLPFRLEKRLTEEGIRLHPLHAEAGSHEDAAITTTVAAGRGSRWLALDGYQFSSAYQRRVKGGGYRLMVIDDAATCAPHACDLVLDQNPSSAPELYAGRGTGSALLLGTRYALLRREVLSARRRQRHAGQTLRILVTLGGGDQEESLRRILAATTAVTPSDVIVRAVVGEAAATAATDAASSFPARVELVERPDDMPALMSWADLAISGGGTTCWELAYLGVPTMIVAVADNQIPSALRVAELGAFLFAGKLSATTDDRIQSELRRLFDDAALRRRLAQKAMGLVDGKGPERVVNAMLSLDTPGLTPPTRVVG